ncbi:hypothetical protein D3C74_119560 [compost metagenome]
MEGGIKVKIAIHYFLADDRYWEGITVTEHIFSLVFRTILMYFSVFIFMRIMGKREIGELSIFDLVISIMIAEIAVMAIDSETPLYDGFAPMITLLVIQIVTAGLSLHYPMVRLWFDGKPSVIIRSGKINRDEMKKQRYNLDDLVTQLRAQKIDNIGDVEFAVLETSGQLSVLPKDNSEKETAESKYNKRDSTNNKDTKEALAASLASKIKYEALPFSLIMDGRVDDDNLKIIGKTRFWLKNQIQAYGVNDFKDVFYCSIDHKGKIYVNKKEKWL